MDIHEGTLVIDGNVMDYIDDLANIGKITAYDGTGAVYPEYDSGEDRTTVIGLIEGPLVTLTIETEPNDANTITPAAGQYVYVPGWHVDLSAETFLKCPYVWRFDHWTGDVANPNSPSTSIVMDTNETVTAVFYADERVCGDECHPVVKGDLNEDCHVDFEDFAIYIDRYWLSCTAPECD